MKKGLLLLLTAVMILSAILALPACGKKTKLPATDYEKVVFAFEGVEKSFQKIGDRKAADLNDRAVGRLLSGGGDPLSILRAIYEPDDSQGDVIDELEYADIAKELNLELNTVRTRIRRGKALLAEMMLRGEEV